jgi:uncharacterized protein
MVNERLPLEEMTLRQLRKVASECGISRYSRMRKDQLLSAIESQQKTQPLQTLQTMQTQPSAPDLASQEKVEAAKFDVGQTDLSMASLADVDQGLGDLPGGYGSSRIVLMPRDPQWAYTYWDIPDQHRQQLRSQGGQQLALRIYDATDIDLDTQISHSIQEYPCDELAREWYLPIPVSDREYVAEIGYRCADGRWLMLARSAAVRIPPTYPSDWIEDRFVTVDWEMDLRGKTVFELGSPHKEEAAVVVTEDNPIYSNIFALAQSAESQRIAGSLFGSMHQGLVHEQSLSSYVFPSGVGLWAVPTASGLNMSGIGLAASVPPIRPRQFWLVADAELIVYGATEPDASVTIGGRPIQLSPDGTFRYQMSFQDGLIDYPILAVAADGEQNRAIHMKFTRETPERRTNTKAEAVQEWFS